MSRQTAAAAAAAAARMGERAGEKFRRTGVPSPNPFPGRGRREQLAAAWRRAYFGATRAGGSR